MMPEYVVEDMLRQICITTRELLVDVSRNERVFHQIPDAGEPIDKGLDISCTVCGLKVHLLDIQRVLRMGSGESDGPPRGRVRFKHDSC
jgi:hypothetical protein